MDRYVNQMHEHLIGVDGQKILKRSRILIVGAGGLGATVAMYLAGSGVGYIVLMDDDIIELQNLHRQVFYRENDIGKFKTEILSSALQDLNHDIQVEVFNFKLHAGMQDIFADYDLVIDCVDDFHTKLLINKLAVVAGVPHIFASVSMNSGLLAYFSHHSNTACLECIYPHFTRNSILGDCNQTGVLGPVAGWVATAQATLALKALIKAPNIEKLWSLNGDNLVSKSFAYQMRGTCNCKESSWASEIEIPFFLQEGPNISEIDLTKFVFCDARSEKEFKLQPYFSKSINLPFDNPTTWPELDKALNIVLFCNGYFRSTSVARLLVSQGLVNVSVLKRPQALFSKLDT